MLWKLELPLLSEGNQLRDPKWWHPSAMIHHESPLRAKTPAFLVSKRLLKSVLHYWWRSGVGEGDGGEEEGRFVNSGAVYSFRISTDYFQLIWKKFIAFLRFHSAEDRGVLKWQIWSKRPESEAWRGEGLHPVGASGTSTNKAQLDNPMEPGDFVKTQILIQ